MEKSENILELVAALSKAQGEMDSAHKDSKNPFFRSNYADLASCWDACRAPLKDNGLAVMQFPEESERGVRLITLLAHSSGQWVKSTYAMPVGKNDAQAIGSALTYARRYALCAVVGISPADDDGNAAAIQAKNKKPDTAPPKKNYSDTKLAKQNKEQPKAEPVEYCSVERFNKNMKAWKNIINEDVYSTKDLLVKIATKTILTEEQVKTIKSWSKDEDN